MNYQRNFDHPENHATIIGCGYCGMSQSEQDAIKQALPALVTMHAGWLQYQPRYTTDVLRHVLPSACGESHQSWLSQSVGDALFAAGYLPDSAYSPDPKWAWVGDLEG